MESDLKQICKSPCTKDCHKRSATCHFDGTCPEYMEFEKASEKRREAKLLQSEMDDYVRNSIAKRLKRDKYKRRTTGKYD